MGMFAKVGSSTSKRKYRPIVRLGILLISHNVIVSVVCCVSGVVALFLLPVLAKNTHVSENALMPGSAYTTLSPVDISRAEMLMKEIVTAGSARTISKLVAEYVAGVGGDFSYHKFYPQLNLFHPLNFFSGPESQIFKENFSASPGVSTVGIIRAPRGDGKEAIVLATPCNFTNLGHEDVLSLGIAYAVFSLLSRSVWLAKDIIWLAADSRYGEYAAVSAWLRDYHNPVFNKQRVSNSGICNDRYGIYDEIYPQCTQEEEDFDESRALTSFRRAGTMAAALVVKVDSNPQDEVSLTIYAEASNGQMPNLDLLNIVNFLAVHRQGLRVIVGKTWSLLDSRLLVIVGKIFEFLGDIARTLNPQWKFSIPVTDYVEGSSALAMSLYSQALGIPSGSHGAFRDYQVDAITLKFSPRFPLDNTAQQSFIVTRGGRLVEGVIRSVNNLLEKFHHSFLLYLLSSSGKFVSVGVYMIVFALFISPLPILAASLYSLANNATSCTKEKEDSEVCSDIMFTSRSWFYAAKYVFAIHLWGAIVSLIPHCVLQIPNLASASYLTIWFLLSIVVLIVLQFFLGTPYTSWTVLKSVTVSATFIGLLLMSVVNFAAAQIEVLLLLPMSLCAHPLKADISTRDFKPIFRAAANVIMVILGFPPALFFVLRGRGTAGLGEYWSWMESLWLWNSATYLCICILHLPCWLLFTQICLN